MRILALEPYYGGSHRAFLDGWVSRSRHDWTVLTLPAYKWKWRMRHGAITLVDGAAELIQAGGGFDVLFCSDMLNLAEFKGLSAGPIGRLPTVAYFHENQLTYPVRHESERDYHYAFTNITTALAADAVWFNSGFHRDEFLGALPGFLKRMPDHQPLEVIERIAAKSSVQHPGIETFERRGPRAPGPMRVLWAARWEHDKNPEAFFEAVKRLKARGVDFRLSVIGERFRDCPPVFQWAKEFLAGHIDGWGYQESRAEYLAALGQADVVVSTADHEFFGLSVAEAVAAGCYPLVPNRLAYPELLNAADGANRADFFYEGQPDQLARRLAELADRVTNDHLWQENPGRGIKLLDYCTWSRRVLEMDLALEQVRLDCSAP